MKLRPKNLSEIDIPEQLYKDLDRDIRRSRLPGQILRIAVLIISAAVFGSAAVGIPVHIVVQKQKKINSLEEQNRQAVTKYAEEIESQEREIVQFKTLYEKGIRELEKKIDRIEHNAPHLLTDTKAILNKFKNAAGSTAAIEDSKIEELLYLVSNHPETVDEAIYQRLINNFGIANYKPKYPFFQHPLAENGRTIVTSEFGRRLLVKRIEDKTVLQKRSDGSYILEGYGGGWVFKQLEGQEFLSKSLYHSAYDVVNDTNAAVYARHDGRIIADFDNYRTYGRTIFYEYREDGHIFREQLSHLEYGPKKFERGGPVRAGEILGYVGETGHTTGPHLHWAVWKLDPEHPERWIAVDVYSNKILKYKNIVYLDNMLK